MILESSRDVLNLTIAFAVLWITVFVCFMLFYVVVMLRNMSKMTVSVREKIELVDNILRLVKEKLEKGSNHMAMVTDTLIKLAGFVMDKHSATTGKKKKK